MVMLKKLLFLDIAHARKHIAALHRHLPLLLEQLLLQKKLVLVLHGRWHGADISLMR